MKLSLPRATSRRGVLRLLSLASVVSTCESAWLRRLVLKVCVGLDAVARPILQPGRQAVVLVPPPRK